MDQEINIAGLGRAGACLEKELAHAEAVVRSFNKGELNYPSFNNETKSYLQFQGTLPPESERRNPMEDPSIHIEALTGVYDRGKVDMSKLFNEYPEIKEEVLKQLDNPNKCVPAGFASAPSSDFKPV